MRPTRIRLISLTIGALLLAGGCVSPDRADPEHELQKARATSRQLEQQLRHERAQRVEMSSQLADAQRQRSSDEQRVAQLRQRIAQLEQQNTRLEEQLTAALTAPLERPDVDAAVLPEDVHAALANYSAALGDRVQYDPARGGLTFANDRLFASGSADVRTDAAASMAELAQVLTQAIKTHPEQDFEVVVVGHTDDVPITRPDIQAQHPTNWHLSVHRAIGVKSLLTRFGVPEGRIAVMGYGAMRPASDQRAKNRRVEIFLAPGSAISGFQPVQP